MKYEIALDNKTFVDKLIFITEKLKTKYNNVPYYNCGYYTESNDCFSFDCWNLVKAIIWGWEDIREDGYYCYHPNKYGLGDWTGTKILKCCNDVSTDFTYLQIGEFLLNESGTHAGVYIGEHEYAGFMFNVVEATPIWLGGVQFSWVDSLGNRKQNKYSTTKFSKWKSHGLLPWVEYKYKSEKEEKIKEEREEKIKMIKEHYCNLYSQLASQIIEGKWGNGAQRIKALNSCGYDYKFAQAIVDAKLEE